jgi:hypothetical protein
VVSWVLMWRKGTRRKKSKSPKGLSAEKFASELLNIFEEKLSRLPTEQQDARIEAFHAKASKRPRAACATTSRRLETPVSLLVARSRE